MIQTSAFCRAQEAAQRERAAKEPLENVRQIALKAAAAWNAEAVWAESRENGHAAIDPMRLSAQEQAEDLEELRHPHKENADHGPAGD